VFLINYLLLIYGKAKKADKAGKKGKQSFLLIFLLGRWGFIHYVNNMPESRLK